MERIAYEVPAWRLNALRVMYALIAFAMGSMIWPLLFNHKPWSVMHSVAIAMLAALSLVCVLGIRYPLQMLPMMLFEFAWKTIWIVAVALPLWRANAMDPETTETAVNCLFGVILCPIVIPWGYVWRHYVRKSGEPWRGLTAT
jgi:hypothetical protein